MKRHQPKRVSNQKNQPLAPDTQEKPVKENDGNGFTATVEAGAGFSISPIPIPFLTAGGDYRTDNVRFNLSAVVPMGACFSVLPKISENWSIGPHATYNRIGGAQLGLTGLDFAYDMTPSVELLFSAAAVFASNNAPWMDALNDKQVIVFPWLAGSVRWHFF